MKEKVIEVKNISKKYGDLIAVKGISFDVYEHEIFGLLGPNGAGKTTTLEIIETLRDETDGDVLVYGMSISNKPEEIKKIIGVQLQESGYYPNLNLKELLLLFAGLYNVKIDPIEILAKVDLVDKQKEQYKRLSGGQKQRFTIATTLINKPKMVFLDEPTTGLDPIARRNLWDLIRKMRDGGMTIVMTTHYMEEAEELCDRVGIVDEGKLVALDTPDNLISNLTKNGFKKIKKVREASLEDVFINLTGKELGNE